MSSAEPDILLARARHAVEKSRRARIVKMILPGFVGVLLFIALSVFDEVLYRYSLNIPFGLLSIILIGVSTGFVVITYLQTGFVLTKEVELEAELAKLRPVTFKSVLNRAVGENPGPAPNVTLLELAELRSEVGALKSSVNAQAALESDEASREFKYKFISDSAKDVAEKAHEIISSKVARVVRSSLILQNFEECRRRLLEEIENLNRRGNINLALGAGTSVVGILLLGITLVYEVTESKDIYGLVSHYLPRLSLIVLIEIFAYFFLRLYKSGLSEIKYFQNELTNVEAKQIALNVAREASDSALIGVVATKLADTERNHILFKNQTTVELEKAKLESESKVAFGKFVSDFFQKIKPST